jgi:hypothetical protein
MPLLLSSDRHALMAARGPGCLADGAGTKQQLALQAKQRPWQTSTDNPVFVTPVDCLRSA